MSKKVLIVGAGGVSRVVTQKCAMNRDVFGKITLASRTLKRCQEIKKDIAARGRGKIDIAQVDADKPREMVALIKKVQPDLVMNIALPYQDLPIMDACLATGVDYLDTANYEPPNEAKFEYSWQWKYRKKFEKAGVMALLGSGFDPGVTNVFSAFALRYRFDTIDTIDILDCNAGDHGYPFATNFNPEINIREVTQRGRYWQKKRGANTPANHTDWDNGEWIETPPLSVRTDFDYPIAGVRPTYLMYHEEMESLVRNIPGLKRIRFWMTFGDNYLTHLRILQNVGMTRIDPVVHKNHKIIPIEFLRTLLPDPASLGPRTKGKTVIGNIVKGTKDGKKKTLYIYQVCDHQESFRETGAQAISYTTGVPAMIGAKMMLTGAWKKAGVHNMEEFDPQPFMDELNTQGLPWQEMELPADYEIPVRKVKPPLEN